MALTIADICFINNFVILVGLTKISYKIGRYASLNIIEDVAIQFNTECYSIIFNPKIILYI